MKMKTAPIFLVFLAMGFGDVVGPMVSLVKDSFNLSYTLAQLLPLVGFIMFGILSVPMGVLQDKKNKKYIINIGLIVAFLGLMIPMFSGMYGKMAIESGSLRQFYIILGSIMALCAGATILQVGGNPIMRDVSDEGSYSSNLSLAQSVKAVGSSLGFWIPPFVVNYFGMDWTVLFPFYAVIILITLILLNLVKIEEKKYSSTQPATLASCFSLLFKNSYVFIMVMAIFLYVGAEVSMSSGVPMLIKANFGYDSFGLWVSWALFFLPILIGRFVGSFILNRIPAKVFLILTTLLSAAGILLLLFGSQAIAFAGIVLVGLGFANVFPLVFSITIDRMPERTNELSGLMITAIAGGAILPLIMGYIADNYSLLISFVVPLLSIIYIAFTGFFNLKKS